MTLRPREPCRHKFGSEPGHVVGAEKEMLGKA
jgi:hypothetical protein